MKDGKLPKAREALLSDAIATSVGALLGTSTVTSYIERASRASPPVEERDSLVS